MAKKKLKKEEVIKDISFVLNMNNSKREVLTDNILTSFRDVQVEPEHVKTRVLFELTRNDKTYRKIMYLAAFRKFLADDLHKRLLAKFFGRALQLAPNFYE